MRVLLRADGDPTPLVASARAAITELDPLLPVSDVRSMAQVVDDFLLSQQVVVTALAVLGVGALLLAAIGVYGLMGSFLYGVGATDPIQALRA